MDSAGKPVEGLQPYMGVIGHLVVFSSLGTVYVHAHPLEPTPNSTSRAVFQTHIFATGAFQGVGQFRLQNIVRVLPFVFKID